MEATPQTEQLALWRRVLWAAAWWLIRLTLCPLLDVELKGFERVPQTGGALLLANHTTFWDFLLCFWAPRRPVHGVGTEDAFRLPVAGTLLRAFNGIPISKGAKDPAAVKALAEAYQKGRMIAMFPEGQRSWTGRPLPVLPGTARLVKNLGCPVVYCRVYTGFLQHPRWARWQRWVPWRMELSAPQTFPPEATVDEILAALNEGIRIDPDAVELPAGSWGFRLAEGLEEYLWACPSCSAEESLALVHEDKNRIRCRECGDTWRVDLATKMNGEGKAQSLKVEAAHNRIMDHFRYGTVALGLDCEGCQISQVRRERRHPEPICTGRARLCDEGLEVVDPAGSRIWLLPFSKMTAVLIQLGSKLHIRTAEANYQVDPTHQSRLRWAHFLAETLKGRGFDVRVG